MAGHIQISLRLCRISVDEDYGIGVKMRSRGKKESNDGDWVPARRAVFYAVFLLYSNIEPVF